MSAVSSFAWRYFLRDFSSAPGSFMSLSYKKVIPQGLSPCGSEVAAETGQTAVISKLSV